MLSCNFWGGRSSQYGSGGSRQGGIQGILDEAPTIPSSILENLMNVTMSPKQKEELLEILEKIRNN
jgi:hypothetical protein